MPCTAGKPIPPGNHSTIQLAYIGATSRPISYTSSVYTRAVCVESRRSPPAFAAHDASPTKSRCRKQARNKLRQEGTRSHREMVESDEGRQDGFSSAKENVPPPNQTALNLFLTRSQSRFHLQVEILCHSRPRRRHVHFNHCLRRLSNRLIPFITSY